MSKRDTLYVMRNTRIPNEFKIGRSQDTLRRKNDLERSQNFSIEILATLPGAGRYETAIRRALAHNAVSNVPGREWVHGPLCYILTVVASIVYPLDTDHAETESESHPM